MSVSFRLTGLTAAMFALLVATSASGAESAPVKCLMMGMGTHKEATMVDVLKDIKEHCPTVQITASENIEDLKYDNLKNYQVLLLLQIKVENGNPPDYVKESLVQFLKGGGGLVVNHFAHCQCPGLARFDRHLRRNVGERKIHP